jgi:2-iminoacetate synthase
VNTSDIGLIEEIKQGARDLKTMVYGNRIVLFAPLYIGNDCVNDCTYCGFRSSNTETLRKTLTLHELGKEVEVLVDRGHKRLILVYGEHPAYDARFIHDTVEKVYSIKRGSGEIRRVNINAAPLDEEGYRLVKESGIGTYQIFMETYHEPTYSSVHPRGPKSSYLWRLHGLDRAFRGGIDDVGIGALLGLHDWRFEVMGLLYHTIHLEETFGVGPHTISFPRIEPALGSELTRHIPSEVTDGDFTKLVAILRLSVPYTGLILTCRESVELRNEVIAYGVSQIDAGSDIGVGAYASQDPDSARKSQFVLADGRSLDQVIGELADAGYVPSFCTACYRAGRTGEHFMEFAVPGFVKRYCTPNAILTLLEYLNDYATPQTREKGLAQVRREVEAIAAGTEKDALKERMRLVEQGERDIYY